MRLEQSGAVSKVWFDDCAPGWEQWLLLRSDAHHDSAYCRRDVELKHLKEAQAKHALILDGGDLFDAMQGRYDPRRSYEDLRPEFATPRYYDAIEDDAAQFYAPFASQFVLLGKGNHEASCLRNVNIDLTSRLAGRLNREHGANVLTGGYGGWVILYFSVKGAGRSSLKLRYFHGAGGAAEATLGIPQAKKQSVYLPDADIIWNGHNHSEYTFSAKRDRISTHGKQYFDLLHFVRTPGYKDDYRDGSSGWAVEKGFSPKPIGAVWLWLRHDGERVRCKAIEDVE